MATARRRRASGAGGSKRLIRAWSFSRLFQYERCPRSAKHKFVDKLEDPPGPAMARGSQIHDLAETYVKQGDVQEVPYQLGVFGDEFKDLRERYAQQGEGRLDVEAELAFTASWEVTGWFDKDAWCRVKIDLLDLDPPEEAEEQPRVVDYKTGTPKGYHEQQLGLYALASMVAWDDLEEVSAELWYLDTGDIVSRVYGRDEVGDLREHWEGRARQLLEDVSFPKKPGNHCRWCPFHRSKGGPCDG